MQKELWLESIYSDGSCYFVSNPTPKTGEKIKIALQMMKNDSVKAVFLLAKFNGCERTLKMDLKSEENSVFRFETEVQVFEKEFRYIFIIASKTEIYYYNQAGLTSYVPSEAHIFRILVNYVQPEWVKNAVFYQIFPERFCNGNPENDVKDGEYIFDGFPCKKVKDWDSVPEPYSKAHCLDFYGGDLEGIRQKIPYLKKLGVTALYLNPIFYAATVHKYDCLDYFSVDPHFGGDKALSDLTDELHKNGIRIILDVSINHTGIANKWFNRDGTFFPISEGAFNNPSSTEREFYFFGKDNSYKGWFDVQTLPTLNYTSEKLRGVIYKNPDSLVKKWLKPPFSTDGWRFDVADTMARNNEIQLHHEIWPEIRKSIKEEKSDAFILAEDWSDCTEFLNGDEWDSQMNYYASSRAIREFYGQHDIFVSREKLLQGVDYKSTAKDLSKRISLFYARLPFVMTQIQFNLLDSHDVPRFHNDNKISKDMLKGALIMLFTLPGSASIYYGDEAEISGTVDSMEGARYPMPWSKNIEETFSYKLYSSLSHLKTEYDSFKNGGFKILWDEGFVFAFARFTPSELFISVCSNSEKIEKIELPLAIFGESFALDKKIDYDFLNESVSCSVKDGKLFLSVPAQKSFLIKI